MTGPGQSGQHRWQRFLQSAQRILTLRCHACQRLESNRFDRRLGIADAVARWGHLLACRVCRRTSRQMIQIERVIASRAVDRDAKLSDRAKDRIAERIQEMLSNRDSDKTQ